MNRILIALSTRRCHGCDDTSFHTAHLTTWGRKRYTGRWSRWPARRSQASSIAPQRRPKGRERCSAPRSAR